MDIAKKSCFAASVITNQTFEQAPEEIYCPYEVTYIWEWFTRLDATRQNGMGHGPITNVEITAWAEGMRLDILPFERECILEIDKAYLIHSNSKEAKNDHTNRQR